MKIDQIIKDCQEKLKSLEKDAENTLRMAQDERLQAEKDRIAIKEEGARQAEIARKQLLGIRDEKSRLEDMQKDLGRAINDQTRLNQELSIKVRKIDENVKETELLKQSAAKELEAKKKLTDDLKIKHSLLKEDFEKLGLRTKELNDRQADLNLKEKIQNKKDEEQVEKDCELVERELKVSNDEKRLSQRIKLSGKE